MPRFNRKAILRRSLNSARQDRKQGAHNRWALFSHLNTDVAAAKFFIRLFHVLRLSGSTASAECQAQARAVLLLALMEVSLEFDESLCLLLVGIRLKLKAQKELYVLDEALKILDHRRFVGNRISRGRAELRNAWFYQVREEGGDGFVKLVSPTSK